MNKILLAGVLFVFLVGVGCSTNNLQKKEVDQTEKSVMDKFVLTTEPQDAIFYIGYGMTGGMGSMPVLKGANDYNLVYNNLSVFFSESFEGTVREKLPSCYEGRPEIKVSAKIQLEKNSSINTSIPPDENGNQPEESYYTAKVLELKNIEVKAVECKD
ncbi:MAG TPA: hypothetical protein DEB09_05495 [Candidatus Magasanikbacteria bacterium]|nr:hypothetical protein [Candidatus Magasanikbacteria bacterium]